MFKKLSIILLTLVLCLGLLVGSANATLSIAKATTYIDYQNAGVSIFKITDAGVLPNYRISTSTAAGAAIEFGATYPYGEAIELRYKVTAWTLIGSSFKALYLRSEATLGGAYGLRCAEFYSVMNTSTTTGLSSLQNIYAEMLVKAGGTRTLTAGTCIEANISIEAQTALTITNNIYALFAKVQHSSGIADYTKLNGIKIAGRGDSAHVLGIALDISDTDTVASTWTTGISITTACTTGIYSTSPVVVSVTGDYVSPPFVVTRTFVTSDFDQTYHAAARVNLSLTNDVPAAKYASAFNVRIIGAGDVASTGQLYGLWVDSAGTAAAIGGTFHMARFSVQAGAAIPTSYLQFQTADPGVAYAFAFVNNAGMPPCTADTGAPGANSIFKIAVDCNGTPGYIPVYADY